MWIEDVEGEFAAWGFRGAVLSEGLSAPALRAWEASARLSAPALIRWFGTKEAMLPRAAAAYVVRLRFQLQARLAAEGWAGFLPNLEEHDDDLRVWAAWEELARHDPKVRHEVTRFRDEVRRRLADHLLPGRYSTIEAPAVLAEDADLALVEHTLHGIWSRVFLTPITDADRAVWAELPELIVRARTRDG